MKYFIVFAILVAAFLLWRNNRAAGGRGDTPKKPRAPAPAQLEDMVSCSLCELHVPQAEATAGRKGMYCCADHRQRAEG